MAALECSSLLGMGHLVEAGRTASFVPGAEPSLGSPSGLTWDPPLLLSYWLLSETQTFCCIFSPPEALSVLHKYWAVLPRSVIHLWTTAQEGDTEDGLVEDIWFGWSHLGSLRV